MGHRSSSDPSELPLKGAAGPPLWTYGVRNAAIILGLVIIGTLLAATALHLTTSLGFMESLTGAMVVLMVGVLFGGGSLWVRDLRVRGVVVHDLGPFPMRKMVFVFGGMAGVGSAILMLVPMFVADISADFTPLLFIAGLAPAFLVAARGRLQILENGLWVYGGLLEWNEILSYRWAGDDILEFRTRSRFVLPWVGAVKVPPTHRDVMRDSLARRVVRIG